MGTKKAPRLLIRGRLHRQPRYHLSSAQPHSYALTGFWSALGGMEAAVTKALDGVLRSKTPKPKKARMLFLVIPLCCNGHPRCVLLTRTLLCKRSNVQRTAPGMYSSAHPSTGFHQPPALLRRNMGTTCSRSSPLKRRYIFSAFLSMDMFGNFGF